MSLSKEDQKTFNDKMESLMMMISNNYNKDQASLSLVGKSSGYYKEALQYVNETQPNITNFIENQQQHLDNIYGELQGYLEEGMNYYSQ